MMFLLIGCVMKRVERDKVKGKYQRRYIRAKRADLGANIVFKVI